MKYEPSVVLIGDKEVELDSMDEKDKAELVRKLTIRSYEAIGYRLKTTNEKK